MEKIDRIDTYTSHAEEMIEGHSMKIENLVNRLLEEGENHPNFLGKGQTAEVYLMGHKGTRAIKVVNSRTIVPGNNQEVILNDLHEEARVGKLIKEAAGQVVEVPTQIIAMDYVEEGKTSEVLIMEAMDAISIEDIINNPSLLPESFNYSDFYDACEEFVKRLEKKGIYHRDLHPGNVMVHRENGKPVIIDFGLSTDRVLGEDPYVVETARGTFRYSKDSDRITQTCRELLKVI